MRILPLINVRGARVLPVINVNDGRRTQRPDVRKRPWSLHWGIQFGPAGTAPAPKPIIVRPS